MHNQTVVFLESFLSIFPSFILEVHQYPSAQDTEGFTNIPMRGVVETQSEFPKCISHSLMESSPMTPHGSLHIHLSIPGSFKTSLLLYPSSHEQIISQTILSVLLMHWHQRRHNDRPTASFYEINTQRSSNRIVLRNKHAHTFLAKLPTRFTFQHSSSFFRFRAYFLFVCSLGS